MELLGIDLMMYIPYAANLFDVQDFLRYYIVKSFFLFSLAKI